jgi:hypothetical protein
MACDASDSKRKWFLDSAVSVSGFVFVPVPLDQLTGHETRRPINLVMAGKWEQRNPTQQHDIHIKAPVSLKVFRFNKHTKKQVRINCKTPKACIAYDIQCVAQGSATRVQDRVQQHFSIAE